jgi:hypothetical protein
MVCHCRGPISPFYLAVAPRNRGKISGLLFLCPLLRPHDFIFNGASIPNAMDHLLVLLRNLCDLLRSDGNSNGRALPEDVWAKH